LHLTLLSQSFGWADIDHFIALSSTQLWMPPFNQSIQRARRHGQRINIANGETPMSETDNGQDAQSTDDRLRLLIERIERLEEEKKGIADDIRDVYAEAKAVGYDVKIMRQIVRLRKMKPDDRSEQEIILETYKAALGMH